MELQLSREITPQIWHLYETSFPTAERRTLERHTQVLDDDRFMPYVMLENGDFVGILFAWIWDNYCFVEHLAVSEDCRCGGYGSKAMRELGSLMTNRTIVLEIDPPLTDIAKRRKYFYERLGYVANSYHYIHPSYAAPHEPHELVVMSYPNRISVDEFIEFQRFALSVL